MNCPRVVIAGTQSGVGKTSISLGLVRALAKRGLKVQTFKVGPDFLDPTHLAVASGRPCYNLDTWMMGREYVLHLFARAAADADVAIVEGVMGLFDGYDPASSAGSTAEMAALLNAPVLLVVNVHGMAQSMAALVKGYADFGRDEGTVIAGVVVNQCGSESHGTLLAECLARACSIPVVGAIPRGGVPVLKSRHLGLVTADENLAKGGSLDNLADAIERHLSLPDLMRIAGTGKPVSVPRPSGLEEMPAVRIGIAKDEAFHFYYQDFFDSLSEHECETLFFSPLHDQTLPENLDGIYIGGGYPEEYGALLSENLSMRGEIRAFAARRRPVYAECGGLMYLSERITMDGGDSYPLVGLLPAGTRMLKRRKALGYVEVTLREETLLGRAGAGLRGHEFHYSELEGELRRGQGWKTVYHVRRPLGEAKPPEGYQWGNVLASYIHLHLPSKPESLAHFLDTCRRRG